MGKLKNIEIEFNNGTLVGEQLSLAQRIQGFFKEQEVFTMKDAYKVDPGTPKTTIRARIYDNLGIRFERISKGVYRTLDNSCLIVEGDGRDLSMIEDNSIDCIITDHPWEVPKSHVGGNRNFTNQYSTFKYELNDFKEKARVLKEGSFLVEILPAENENNFDYLYSIKKMAEECGLLYYSKVPWKKGTFVANTGRKAKNTEDIMIFSKGKARNLRPDAKKTKKEGTPQYMSGTAAMLPTCFDVQAVGKKEKIHQSEKPVELWMTLLDYITLEGEVILDQFAGSGSLAEAIQKKNRKGILIEIDNKNIELMKQRLKLIPINNLEQIPC